jgi:putative DNA primase/helicase
MLYPPPPSQSTPPDSEPSATAAGAGAAVEAAAGAAVEAEPPPAEAEAGAGAGAEAEAEPPPAADPSATAADPVVVELQSILSGIRAKEPKGVLADRLEDLTLTGSADQDALLTRISREHGWAKIVATLNRPQRICFGRERAGSEAKSEAGTLTESDVRRPPPGLPVGWRDPPMWVCSSTGIYYQKDTPEGPVLARLLQRPLWIGRRWTDIDSGAWTVDVQWPGGSAIVGREVAMDSRGIIGLAAKGAPVGSSSARAAAQWLEISEQHNVRIVPVETAISRLGWTKTADGYRALQTPAGPHMLRPPDGEPQELSDSVRTAGTFAGWLKAAQEVNRSPVAAIMLAASVASVMLEATGAASFAVDLCGKSSRGKTTALRWAASAWGDPSDGGYMANWNATQVFIERRAGFLHNLPLCLDESKQLSEKAKEELKNIIHMWSGGKGRGRGSVAGTCETATWRSILLSTGESPLSILGGHHEGMKYRVVTLTEQPFSEAKLCDPILSLADYGHVGPMVAAWTVRHWDELKDRWEQRRDKTRLELGSGCDRLAEYVATLTLAGNALVACGVPMPLAEMKDMLYKAARATLAGSDIAGEAFHRIGEWLSAHPDRISGATARTEVPNAGWIGRVIDTGVVGVLPADLENQLKKLGYEPEEVTRQWVDRGFLVKGKDGFKIQSWLNAKPTRMYNLKIEGWKVWQPEAPPAHSDSDQVWHS